MEEKYKQWDKFIAHLILCQSSALSKYKYFLLTDLRPNEVYDFLFFKTLTYANQITKSSKIYGTSKNIFKFIKFKLKEHKIKYFSIFIATKLDTKNTHICDFKERVQLIEELAEQHNIIPEDLSLLYKEYYSK